MQNATVPQLLAFEKRVVDIFSSGDLPFLIHLGGGNEEQLVKIFESINPGDWVLCSHRAHHHYLLAGGTEAELEEEIRAGRSMYLFNKRINFMTSSILAGMAPIAAGIAWALKEEGSKAHVWNFIGDGASDEGNFFESACFVEGHDLPCTFVIEDNDQSVDTNKIDRYGKEGHYAVETVFAGFKHVQRYRYKMTVPHCGPGLSGMIQFNPAIVAKHAEANQ